MDIKKFFSQSKFLFSRVPIEPFQQKDPAFREIIYSIAVGLLVNWGIHKIPGYDTSSIFDEVTIISAIISAYFFGKLKDLRMLCQSTKDHEHSLKTNQFNASIGGLGVGLSGSGILLGLQTVLGLSDLLITGGIISLTLLSVGSALAVNNKIDKKYKEKKCPRCEKSGKCNQRICRNCYKIFYPENVEITCKNHHKLLDWKTIACYLDKYHLSYLDAEILVYDHITDWKIVTTKDNQIFLSCTSFKNWIDINESELSNYIGEGKNRYSEMDAMEYLDESGL